MHFRTSRLSYERMPCQPKSRCNKDISSCVQDVSIHSIVQVHAKSYSRIQLFLNMGLEGVIFQNHAFAHKSKKKKSFFKCKTIKSPFSNKSQVKIFFKQKSSTNPFFKNLTQKIISRILIKIHYFLPILRTI